MVVTTVHDRPINLVHKSRYASLSYDISITSRFPLLDFNTTIFYPPHQYHHERPIKYSKIKRRSRHDDIVQHVNMYQYVMLFVVLRCCIVCCYLLCCCVLYCIVYYCFRMCYIVLYYIILYYTLTYCTTLCYVVLGYV